MYTMYAQNHPAAKTQNGYDTKSERRTQNFGGSSDEHRTQKTSERQNEECRRVLVNLRTQNPEDEHFCRTQ